ncbi:MAG: cytochrome c [Gemmatimonadota bacterium]|jgi:mono/diheme cytochrome c family protein
MFKATSFPLARVLLVGLLLFSGSCTPLDDVMAGIFGRSMRNQTSFDPYEDPRNAPEGSVPFASGTFPARAGEVNVGQPDGLEDVPPPFTQLDVLNEANVVVGIQNPVAATEESLDRGQELFLRFCAPCHGPNASGVSGYILPAGYPPYSLVTERVAAFTDGHIYGMIRMGRGNMPAYGHRITHFDRWHVVNYLRVLQGVASPPAVDEGGGEAPSS